MHKYLWKYFSLILVFFVFIGYANAENSQSLTRKTQIFIPISPGSFRVAEIPFFSLEDPEMTYLLSIIKELPKEYRMKICLDEYCLQQRDIIGPLNTSDSHTLRIGIFAPAIIEEGRELSTRWAIGPELGEDSSSSVIVQVYVYPLLSKQISMILDKKEVFVNNELKMLDVPAQVMQGRTMVPFRFLGEQLGAKIDFEMNSETRLVSNVSFSLGKLTLKLWINETEAEVKIDREIEKTTLDVPPVIIAGRTLVPVRFVAEQMGAKVEWIPEKREVLIWFPSQDAVPNDQFLVFFHEISAKELKDSLETKPWKILDIRTEDDFKKGHLPGAIHFPAHYINEEGLSLYGLETHDHVVLYCNSGIQSGMGAERMIRLGMQKVYSLFGGIKSWTYDIDS